MSILSGKSHVTHRGRREPARAFTLLELVVAMVIFAVLGTAILLGFHQSMKSTVTARDYSTAVLLAKRALTDLHLAGPLTAGLRSGPPEPAFPGYSWQATVAPVSGRDGLFDVVLEIRVERGGSPHSYRLQTRLFQVPPSGGGS